MCQPKHLGRLQLKNLLKLLNAASSLPFELPNVTTKSIKIEEIHVESYKKARMYKERKKKLNGRQILHREIPPVNKLSVLNTRLKSVYRKHKPR